MTQFNFFRNLMLVAAATIGLGAMAQNGAPHTVTASTTIADVNLEWKAPASPITMCWHDNSSYNGMDGQPAFPGGPLVIYAANQFAPADVQALVGQQIKSISFFDYCHAYKVNVQIYEDKVLVVDQPADLTTFTRNTFKEVALATPYTVPAGKELLIVARYEYSPTFGLVATTDRTPTPGKGDIYSYDGKTWYQGAVGDFMITANFVNDFAGEPMGYNVYRDGTKVNADIITETNATLKNEPAGTHTYVVAAVYADGEKNSYAVQATPQALNTLMPPAATFKGKATELAGTLSWQAPLKGGNTLTWSSDAVGLSIGGTASSNTKVWIKQEFTANDLLAFKNYQINNIAAYINENTITGITMVIFKNDVIDYSEVVSDEVIAGIQAPAWNTFNLTTPYVMEPGNKYAYALYYLHTPKTHPVGVDNTEAVDTKGNSFSVTSASSTFNNSKPTWKTLASGSIAGNLMLKAGVSPVGEATAVMAPTGYDLYRNGQMIASNLTTTTYDDEVENPGVYQYSLETKYDGMTAPARTLSMAYTMPAAYGAPILSKGEFNNETKEVSLAWNASAIELRHYGTANYKVGFDEELNMIYGAKFTAAELAPYVGYKFDSFNFCMGDQVAFTFEVRTGSNEVLYSLPLGANDYQAVALYTLSPDKDIIIPANEDIYICYNMTAPGQSTPIILDAGPLVDGGAMISLTQGANWMRMGTFNPTYNNYNVVVGGTVVPATSSTPAQGITLGRELNGLEAGTISAADVREAAVNGFGIETLSTTTAPTRVARKAASKPNPAKFLIYRNNEVVAETTESQFTETLNLFGSFNYNVVTVFDNGWQSPKSETFNVDNFIGQNAPAPYDLRGEATVDGTLALSWEAPGLVQEFTYQKDYSKDLKSGMTGSGAREGYHAIRMSLDTMQYYVGQKITHIKFKLSEDVNTASVFVLCGENVIYEQEIPAGEFGIGWNVIRLNTPFEIPENPEQEYGVGYHITYPNGVKPFTLDPTPAIPLYNDIISSAGTFGYWYSLKTKFKLDYGYRISAVLQKPDSNARRVARKATAGTTYNVYYNGNLIAGPIGNTSYDVLNAQYGEYVVTAIDNDVESAPSNAVNYTRMTGVNDLNVDNATISKTIEGNQVVIIKNGVKYNTMGQVIK